MLSAVTHKFNYCENKSLHVNFFFMARKKCFFHKSAGVPIRTDFPQVPNLHNPGQGVSLNSFLMPQEKRLLLKLV